MANLFSSLQNLGNFMQDIPKSAGKLINNLDPNQILSVAKPISKAVKPEKAIDDIAAGVASKLAVPRGIGNTIGGLTDLAIEKGQTLKDAAGTAQKSFYQGQIPNETLARFASPTIGAGTGAAAGGAISGFIPHPLGKAAAVGIGALGGGLLGSLGMGQLTPEQKKAAQIRGKEAGWEKQFSNPQQLGINAQNALPGFANMAVDAVTGAQSIGGHILKGGGQALIDTNNPTLKKAGEIINKMGSSWVDANKAVGGFARDKINYASNMPFKPKDEMDGRKKVKDLPLEVIQNMSPEAVRAMVLGENFEKVSIPSEISLAYRASLEAKAQNEIINTFRKEGKTDQEIEELVKFGMAGKPLESVAESVTSDPTMLLDFVGPAAKGIRAISGAGRANKLKTLKEGRALTQLERAKGSVVNPETGQLQMKGLKSEITNVPDEFNQSDIENLIQNIDNPDQAKLDFNAAPNTIAQEPTIPKQPNQIEQPKSIDNFDNDLLEQKNKLMEEGIDLDSFEGDEALIQNLLDKGYDESEILSKLSMADDVSPSTANTLTSPETNIPTNRLDEIDEIYKPLEDERYINPSEDDIYNTMREGTIPGLDENQDLTYKLTQGGGLPVGFYENDKLVPIYQDVATGAQKRLPVKFQFSSPLEKEIFTKYGGEYVDWLRDSLVGNIKAEKGIENTSTAQKVLTDKQKEERFRDLGSRLLTGTSDPTYLDSLPLPEEGKKEVTSLMDEFVKNLYSGKKTNKEGVIGHVPNSIRKDILKQISSKLQLDGLSAAEKKARLSKLTPEDLGDEAFKLSSTAYKGIIDKTKEFRSKFKDILGKYKKSQDIKSIPLESIPKSDLGLGFPLSEIPNK